MHEVPVWDNNLYLFAQMLFKPAGSVTPPPSIGTYDGTQPVSMGMGMPGMGRGPMPGAGAPGGGMNTELTARRENSSAKGIEGKWIAKDGNNEIKLDFKVDGSKLTGTIENTQMPGAIEFKEGKIKGNEISFTYFRQMGGQNFDMKWTGTLSGDELKLKRIVGGGMGGFGGGR